ncbi:MAG: hypothetical protein HF967_09775, partial [Methanosarcinales archaeon]|nr:hypothetical protein [Methanosarcinales archaeon]
MAVIGVNANNFGCPGGGTGSLGIVGGNGEDIISFVCFKDITSGTVIDMTDNGWERVSPNLFGDTEGTIRCTYNGGTIPAGQVITFVASNSGNYSCVTHPAWTYASLNTPGGSTNNFNLNNGGDQVYFMQGGTWNWGAPANSTHDATYLGGRFLFGFNTSAVWQSLGMSTQHSGLHPEVIPCFHMEPSSGQTDFLRYNGLTTAATQVEWIARIADASNWQSFPDCNAYNAANTTFSSFADISNLVNLPILPSEMSIDCTTCTGGCGTLNETLVFNLPTSGGPFDVTYTDGTNTFTLNNINNLHPENVTLTASTTFSLVSVTAANGCPTYSNFSGDAVITFSGTGGGAMASLTGGGILCSENCTTITVLVSGGTAPYDLDVNVMYPPLINITPSLTVPNTNFVINVCADGNGINTGYNPATSTLTLPSVIVGNVSFTLTGITDNSGCAGTVDGTPLFVNIETTPTANPANMSECGTGTATFDLTTLNNTVNGNSGNAVTWYSNAAATISINNPSNYISTTTTVYAISSTANCDSPPAAVQLTVTPAPIASPATLQVCASGAQGTFDLTSVNSTVNGGNGNTVTWYSNAAATSPILTPSAYPSGATTVYAVVTVGTCNSTSAPVSLTIMPAPIGIPSTIIECELAVTPTFGNFNLTAINNTVNGNSGLPVTWYTNANATSLVPNPIAFLGQNNTIVYAVVGTAPCTSVATAISLFVTPMPTASTASLTGCAVAGNQAIFDLTSVNNTVNGNSGNTVTWYSNPSGTAQIFTPTTHISGTGAVFAVVGTGSCTSAPIAISLTAVAAPTANNTSTSACDLGNGIALFDLNILANNVNSTNTVNWFSDANATIPITSPYATVATTIYAVASNGSCFSSPATVTLNIDAAPTAINSSATTCDLGNGTGDFDLTFLENTINDNTGNTVSWFSDMNATIPISFPYTTAPTTVYAEVSSGNCTSIASIILTLNSAPTATTTTSESCNLTGGGSAEFDLSLISLMVNNNSNYAVSWFLYANMTNPLPSPFTTATTTVYAVVSDGGGCISLPTPVDLNVILAPVGNPTSATECEVSNGQAIFDLTALENIVTGGSGDPVAWYSDLAATVSISSPYNTGTTIVYAVITGSNSCSSTPVPVDLTVMSIPTATTTSTTACDTGNGTGDFDLTVLENTINGGNGNTVNWYADMNATNVITSPYNSATTTVFTTVSNGNCSSAITPIVLTVESAPAANPTGASECDTGNGTAIFDLSLLENIINGSSGNTVAWYSDLNATTIIPSPYTTSTTTVYATVTNGNCISSPVAINLTVSNSPTANTSSSTECDNGSGTATFILTDLDQMVNGNTTNTVTWYSDLNATTTIPSPYTTSTVTVYAVVGNGSCISSPVAVDLNIEALPVGTSTSTSLCDSGSGTATFDLSLLENTINGGNTNTVNWYSNANGTSIINTPFTTSTTTIYAVVDNGNCTSTPVAIDLTVENGPSITATSASECDEGNGTATFDLSLLENIINGGNGNTVNWYDDPNGNNPITSPYNSTTNTIYATTSDANCTSPIEAIDLTVNNLPQSNPASDTQCGGANGMANFDLDALANTVNGGNGNTVTWYSDINLTNIITSPYNTVATTIYAVVNDGTCNAATVNVTLNISNTLIANATTLASCDDGTGNMTGIFDLTFLENDINGGNGNTVTWYSDAAGTIPLSPINTYVTTSTSVYATVSGGGCASAPVEIPLTVLGQINAFQTSASECNTGNGTGSFNLDNIADMVTGGNGNSVQWFSDQNMTNPISSPYLTAPTTVYAVATDGFCFSNVVEVLLLISQSASGTATTATLCDEGNNMATFDLNMIATEVNPSAGVFINWYSDLAGTTSISSPYTTGSTTIYAVVSNGNCDSDPVEVTLDVVTALDAFSTTATQCDEGNGTATFDLSLLENTVTGGSGNTVLWYSDMAAMTPITSPFISGNNNIYAIVTDGNCSSSVVEITLTVTTSIPAFTANDTQCDEGSGTAIFPLTNLETTVNGGSANTVNWFEDMNMTISITPPFSTISNTIYAVVVDGSCTSAPVAVDLTVEGLPAASSTSASVCDDGNGTGEFDLTPLENIINGATNNTVNWYENIDATNPITSPYTSSSTTIYATVSTASCTSPTVPITLTVNDLPNTFFTNQSQCDEGNGEAIFDLDAMNSTVNGGNGNTVTWFSDAAATIPIASLYTSPTTNIYAVVTDGTCTAEPIEIELLITNTLAAFTTSDTQCDVGNGTAIFDLDALAETVNGGTGFQVNWFFNAAATNPIPSPYTTAPSSVYAVVVDGSCASLPVEIPLTIANISTANPATATECDSGNGTATFALTNLENTITGGNGNTVLWYEDVNTTLPITPPYTTISTTIYAVSANGNCISAPASITLTVTENLPANPASNTLCDDGTGIAIFDLASLENTINGGNGLTVNWYEDMNATIPISTSYTSGTTIVYAVVDNGSCTSTPVAVNLTVIDDIPADPASATQCADNTGAATFDLTLLEETININSGNTVQWFDDINLTNPIASPYNVLTTTTIYAIVVEGLCTSDPVQVTLNVVNDMDAFPATATQCDSGNGTATFDLSLLENTINGGNTNTVNFYSDVNGTNLITSPYTSAATSIYAIVTDGNCFSQPVEITLEVSNNLSSFPATATECDTGNGTAIFDLSLLENTINGATGNTVNFFSDINGMNPITSPYTSAATSIYAIVTDGNCSSQITLVTLEVSNN